MSNSGLNAAKAKKYDEFDHWKQDCLQSKGDFSIY